MVKFHLLIAYRLDSITWIKLCMVFKDTKRARFTFASDEALYAFKLVTKLENIRPSLEPCHAFAECVKIAPKLKDQIIIVNNCGEASKDKNIAKELGYYPS